MSSVLQSWPSWVMGSETLTVPRAHGAVRALPGVTPGAPSSCSLWRIPSLLPGKHMGNPWIVQKWTSPVGSHNKVLFLAGVADSPLPFLEVWYPPGSKPSSLTGVEQNPLRASSAALVLLFSISLNERAQIKHRVNEQDVQQLILCEKKKKNLFCPPLFGLTAYQYESGLENEHCITWVYI